MNLFIFFPLLLLFNSIPIILSNNNCNVTVSTGVFYESINQTQLEIPTRYITYYNNYHNNHVNFNTTPLFLKVSDLFHTGKSLCSMLEQNNNIVAIFGSSFETSPILQSISITMGIPYIQTHWLPSNYFLESELILNMYPDSDLLSEGYAAMVNNFHWDAIMIIYESLDVLVRLKDIIKMENSILNKIDENNIALTLKQARNLEVYNIIIDCSYELTSAIFKTAKELDMLNIHYNYFVTSLDTYTIDPECNDDCNITTTSLYHFYDQSYLDLIKNWERNERKHRNYIKIDPYDIKTETILLYDAYTLLVDAVNSIKGCIEFPGYSCNSTNNLNVGRRIVEHMRSNYETFPITGPPEIDLNGKRTNFTLYLFDYNQDVEEPLAAWNSLNKEVVVLKDSDVIAKQLSKTTFIVFGVIKEPYMMYKKDHENLEGNDRFEGYCVDLIREIAKRVGFTYEIHLVTNANDAINGVHAKKGHLAIGDITITSKREELVDFSLPFMRLGISVMYRKLDEDVRLFKFLDPLTIEVWLSTGTLVVAQAVVLYFVARMAPGDWENPHPCDPNPKKLVNIWNMKNCLWLTVGSIMNQGCDILPKGISSRMVTTMWWFMAMIITQSYIASLAAFLTNKQSLVIKDVADLAKQNKIIYGTQEDGSTYSFFKYSNNTAYAKMFETMNRAKPKAFEHTLEEAIRRVITTIDGTYAFLAESTTIEFFVERHCDLQMVKNVIQPSTFGIAMPKNYYLRTKINDAILNLEEAGSLIGLKNEWWKEKNENLPCVASTTGDALTVQQLGGVFLILGSAVIGALIFGVLEFLYNVYNVFVERKISLWEAFKMELAFALKIWISKKRANVKTNNHLIKNSDRSS